MPEDFGGLDVGGGLDQGGEVTEEDLVRVREDMQKAASIWGQTKISQAQNSSFAYMLSVLLKHVDDENLLGMILSQMVDHKVSIPDIFAQFLPILKSRVDVSGYTELYANLREHMPTGAETDSMTTWLGRARSVSDGLKTISHNDYLIFSLAYLRWASGVDVDSMKESERDEFVERVGGLLG